MKAIYKYPLEITGRQNVAMPDGAEILTAQMQGGQLCLWAAVQTDNPPVDRRIEIYGTGHPMPDGARVYIGTAQLGPLVWHVFERTEREF